MDKSKFDGAHKGLRKTLEEAHRRLVVLNKKIAELRLLI